MAVQKVAEKASGGRQAAYTARNRAAIVRSAQRVLADIGPFATIEQLAESSQVSPTTIYKYFKNKDLLFSEALNQIWIEWVEWSYNGVPEGESLEAVIDVARKLFWIKDTHPLFAKILRNTLSNPDFVIRAVRGSAEKIFKQLAKKGELASDNFEIRINLYSSALAGILIAVHVNEEMSPAKADQALAIAMRIFDVPESKAKKIVSRKLVFAPINKPL